VTTPPPPPPATSPSGPPPASATPAGWFPDPNRRHEHRYFNGQRWTADVADQGQRSVDPLGAGPTPGDPATPPAGSSSGNGNGIATAALVTGIIGVILAWIPFLVVIGFVLAVLALVFGIQGSRRRHASGRGKATAGLVLGGVGVALSIVGVILTVVVWREAIAFLEPADHDIEVTACTVDGAVATATGTITNLDDERAEFTLYVTIRPDAGRTAHARTRELGVLAPGATVEWSAVDTVGANATTCTASVDVYGPTPFGIDIEEPPQ